MIVTRLVNIVTVAFSEEEAKVLNWLEINFGNNEIRTVLDNFLTQRKAQMDDTAKNDLWNQVKDHPDIIQVAIDSAKGKINGKP